jgi:HAD superfamily phosphoserine phosphatase-like hydrolase
MQSNVRKGVVCFDFDNVLVDGNLGIMVLEQFMSVSVKLEALMEFFSHADNLQKLLKKFASRLKGKSVGEISVLVKQLKPMKNAGRVLKDLKARGYEILIVSQDDVGLIKEFLKAYGLQKYVDDISGISIEAKAGRLTGSVRNIRNMDKVYAVKRLLKKHKVKKKDIIYIGDSANDLPVMKIVGKAILFCPDILTKAKVKEDKTLGKMFDDGRLVIIDNKDMEEVLSHINEYI